MQYLECLSAALKDMSYTYQPAERMSTVLDAVMAELRGGADPGPHGFIRPRGAIVPARRGSTMGNEAEERPSFKRRHTARPHSRSLSSRERAAVRDRRMSQSAMSIDLNIDPALAAMHHRKESDADRNHPDGYIMVTPRTDMSGWPGVPLSHVNTNGSDRHEIGSMAGHSSTVDPMGLTHTPATTLSTSGPRTNTWMGADLDLDPDNITNLASVHFPEMAGFSEGDTAGAPLDFMALGDSDWKEWQTGASHLETGQNDELSGFTHHTGFAGTNGFPSTPGAFVQ